MGVTVIIKKILKILWLCFIGFIALIFAAHLLIQSPRFQTFIAEKVTKTLSEKIDGDISVGKIHLKTFSTLILKNILIIDKHPSIDPLDSTKTPIDTFFKAEYVIADFSLRGLLDRESIKIDKAYISNAQMNLVLENGADPYDKRQDKENLSRIFGLKKDQPKKPVSEDEIFCIKDIEIKNIGFSLINNKLQKTPYHGGINWNDMVVKNINISASSMRFKGGVMYGTLNQLDFVEKSGFVCKSISGSTKVGNGKTIIDNIKIVDDYSNIHLKQFVMSYDNSKDFGDFVNKVGMKADISNTTLDFKTLSFFAPQLGDNNLKLNVSGSAEGPVKDLNIKGITVRSHAGGFSGTIKGHMRGLPFIESTTLDFNVENFHLTSKGLGDFVTQWMKDGKTLDLSRFGKGLIFMLKANGKGTLNSLSVNADISSMVGKVKADLLLSDLIDPKKDIGIDGSVSTYDLNVGKIIGNDLIGQVSLNTGVKTRFGEGAPEITIDSLYVDRLHLNDYDYSGIAAVGEWKEQHLDGRLICNDPNLNFLLQGRFATSPKTKNAIYKFYANIGDADLRKLNIDKRGPSKMRMSTSGEFTKTGSGDFVGNINIGGLVLSNSAGKYDIGDINLVMAQIKENHWNMMLKSRFADGQYNGTAPVGDFISDLMAITIQKEIPALFEKEGKPWSENEYNIDFKFHNSMDVLSFAVPGLYIADSTSFNLSINKEGQLKSVLKSPRIAMKDKYLKGVNAVIDNERNTLTGKVFCNEIKVGTISTGKNELLILANENKLGAGFSYQNNSELMNQGEFVLRSDFSRDEDNVLNAKIELLPTSLLLNSREWNIQPSTIRLHGNDIKVDSFELTSGEQRIRLEGGTSKAEKDTLSLTLDRFDISILNPIIKNDLNITGAATGRVQLTSPMEDLGLLADVICDSTYIAGVPLGVLSAGSTWNEEFERFDISLRNDYNGKSNIDAEVSFVPKHKSIQAKAALSELQVGYIQPFVKDIFSKMNGSVSGNIFLEGPFDNLKISSEDCRVDDIELKIAYTNVPYFAKGSFHIDSYGVYLDDISVKDSYTGTGKVSGGIKWDHFRDMNFDIKVDVTDIEGVNLTKKQGDIFYGHLFATGNIGISGPTQNLRMSIDAVTSKSGQIHIPLSNVTGTNNRANLLKFKEEDKDIYIDPYEALITKIKKKEKKAGNLAMRMRVTASQDVEAFLELDKESGNLISGRGNGTLDLTVDKDVFAINGDYTLRSGNCRFNALGLAVRDFTIQDGSSIRFGGDIMESTLNINAAYRTKASLSTLISDTTSVSNKRYVDCGISITDKISNPRLKFSIEVPDLDPMIKSRVESALSTEDKVQRQFLSLLISNNFIPDDQSGIVNNSTVLYSSVSEILANQINNIFQKLNIPLDLGLNYQPNQRGRDIFDVAVSTQLFNNRVTVNGNIGNRQYSTGNSRNDIVGDIDIEIKLDRSGAIRLTLFSHSADQYTSALDNSQRNGVGVTYQTEFNTFKQFFKNIFSTKTKRRQARMEEEKAMINEGKVVINIEKNQQTKKNGRKRKTVSDTLSAGGK